MVGASADGNEEEEVTFTDPAKMSMYLILNFYCQDSILGNFVPEMKCLGIALISVYFLPSPVERKINCAELLALCP